MIEEVRCQFRNSLCIMAGTEKPDYARCVDISTAGGFKQMIVPGLMAVVAPLAMGLILGADALGGLLAGALVTGVLMAIFMANAGGAFGIMPRNLLKAALTAEKAVMPIKQLLLAIPLRSIQRYFGTFPSIF